MKTRTSNKKPAEATTRRPLDAAKDEPDILSHAGIVWVELPVSRGEEKRYNDPLLDAIDRLVTRYREILEKIVDARMHPEKYAKEELPRIYRSEYEAHYIAKMLRNIIHEKAKHLITPGVEKTIQEIPKKPWKIYENPDLLRLIRFIDTVDDIIKSHNLENTLLPRIIEGTIHKVVIKESEDDSYFNEYPIKIKNYGPQLVLAIGNLPVTTKYIVVPLPPTIGNSIEYFDDYNALDDEHRFKYRIYHEPSLMIENKRAEDTIVFTYKIYNLLKQAKSLRKSSEYAKNMYKIMKMLVKITSLLKPLYTTPVYQVEKITMPTGWDGIYQHKYNKKYFVQSVVYSINSNKIPANKIATINRDILKALRRNGFEYACSNRLLAEFHGVDQCKITCTKSIKKYDHAYKYLHEVHKIIEEALRPRTAKTRIRKRSRKKK